MEDLLREHWPIIIHLVAIRGSRAYELAWRRNLICRIAIGLPYRGKPTNTVPLAYNPRASYLILAAFKASAVRREPLQARGLVSAEIKAAVLKRYTAHIVGRGWTAQSHYSFIAGIVNLAPREIAVNNWVWLAIMNHMVEFTVVFY